MCLLRVCFCLVLLLAIVFLANVSVTVLCLLLCLVYGVMSFCCDRCVMVDVLVLSFLLFCVLRG